MPNQNNDSKDNHLHTNHSHDVHHACTQVENCSHDSEHIHLDEQNKESVIKKRVAEARDVCLQKGLRFTKLREQVYKLVLLADKPIGAYDLLSQMQQQINKEELDSKTKSKNIAPPTVYRSLEFLLEVGFIHQLSSINAFVPCCHPRDKHMAGFLICTKCNRVQECSNSAIQSLINHTKNSIGFSVNNAVVEMTGICQGCQNK